MARSLLLRSCTTLSLLEVSDGRVVRAAPLYFSTFEVLGVPVSEQCWQALRRAQRAGGARSLTAIGRAGPWPRRARARGPRDRRYARGMDWKLFGSTFLAIFLAELGDKTQLTTFSLAAGGASRWVVFGGAALALVATSAFAVIAGEAVARAIPPIWLKRGAGALFVVMGLLFLLEDASA